MRIILREFSRKIRQKFFLGAFVEFLLQMFYEFFWEILQCLTFKILWKFLMETLQKFVLEVLHPGVLVIIQEFFMWGVYSPGVLPGNSPEILSRTAHEVSSGNHPWALSGNPTKFSSLGVPCRNPSEVLFRNLLAVFVRRFFMWIQLKLVLKFLM